MVVQNIKPHLENDWECETAALNMMKNTYFAQVYIASGFHRIGEK